jgi:hypothetical protein
LLGFALAVTSAVVVIAAAAAAAAADGDGGSCGGAAGCGSREPPTSGTQIRTSSVRRMVDLAVVTCISRLSIDSWLSRANFAYNHDVSGYGGKVVVGEVDAAASDAISHLIPWCVWSPVARQCLVLQHAGGTDQRAGGCCWCDYLVLFPPSSALPSDLVRLTDLQLSVRAWVWCSVPGTLHIQGIDVLAGGQADGMDWPLVRPVVSLREGADNGRWTRSSEVSQESLAKWTTVCFNVKRAMRTDA